MAQALRQREEELAVGRAFSRTGAATRLLDTADSYYIPLYSVEETKKPMMAQKASRYAPENSAQKSNGLENSAPFGKFVEIRPSGNSAKSTGTLTASAHSRPTTSLESKAQVGITSDADIDTPAEGMRVKRHRLVVESDQAASSHPPSEDLDSMERERKRVAEQPLEQPAELAIVSATVPPSTISPSPSSSKGELLALSTDIAPSLGARPPPRLYVRIPRPPSATTSPLASPRVSSSHLSLTVSDRLEAHPSAPNENGHHAAGIHISDDISLSGLEESGYETPHIVDDISLSATDGDGNSQIADSSRPVSPRGIHMPVLVEEETPSVSSSSTPEHSRPSTPSGDDEAQLSAEISDAILADSALHSTPPRLEPEHKDDETPEPSPCPQAPETEPSTHETIQSTLNIVGTPQETRGEPSAGEDPLLSPRAADDEDKDAPLDSTVEIVSETPSEHSAPTTPDASLPSATIAGNEHMEVEPISLSDNTPVRDGTAMEIEDSLPITTVIDSEPISAIVPLTPTKASHAAMEDESAPRVAVQEPDDVSHAAESIEEAVEDATPTTPVFSEDETPITLHAGSLSSSSSSTPSEASTPSDAAHDDASNSKDVRMDVDDVEADELASTAAVEAKLETPQSLDSAPSPSSSSRSPLSSPPTTIENASSMDIDPVFPIVEAVEDGSKSSSSIVRPEKPTPEDFRKTLLLTADQFYQSAYRASAVTYGLVVTLMESHGNSLYSDTSFKKQLRLYMDSFYSPLANYLAKSVEGALQWDSLEFFQILSECLALVYNAPRGGAARKSPQCRALYLLYYCRHGIMSLQADEERWKASDEERTPPRRLLIPVGKSFTTPFQWRAFCTFNSMYAFRALHLGFDKSSELCEEKFRAPKHSIVKEIGARGVVALTICEPGDTSQVKTSPSKVGPLASSPPSSPAARLVKDQPRAKILSPTARRAVEREMRRKIAFTKSRQDLDLQDEETRPSDDIKPGDAITSVEDEVGGQEPDVDSPDMLADPEALAEPSSTASDDIASANSHAVDEEATLQIIPPPAPVHSPIPTNKPKGSAKNSGVSSRTHNKKKKKKKPYHNPFISPDVWKRAEEHAVASLPPHVRALLQSRAAASALPTSGPTSASSSSAPSVASHQV